MSLVSECTAESTKILAQIKRRHHGWGREVFKDVSFKHVL